MRNLTQRIRALAGIEPSAMQYPLRKLLSAFNVESF